MTFSIVLPYIDPVAIQIGPIAIRWYALAYIAGLLIGWRLLRRLAGKAPVVADKQQVDDYLSWATAGVILGGRLGYVLFYKPAYYLSSPLEILYIWQGGMSFHGGLLGVVAATVWFCRRNKIDAWRFGDIISCVAPIGLFFGRIANFINGELVGRISDVPWAVVFPGGGPAGRHPSQLYEALLEGALLFAIVNLTWRIECVRSRPGLTTGIFLLGYAIARTVAELFRQPDGHIGFILGFSTMGQWLSAPVALAGTLLILRETLNGPSSEVRQSPPEKGK